MARVTVEDCVGEEKTKNRFELVILSAQRTKDIQSGSPITLPEDRDKAHVIALREIAAGNVKISDLRKKFTDRIHNRVISDNFDETTDEISEFVSEESFVFDDVDNFALSEEEMLIDNESIEINEDDISEDEQKF